MPGTDDEIGKPLDAATAPGLTINRLDTPFPEPAFSAMQRRVFAAVQSESPALAAALEAERAQAEQAFAEPPTPSPMVRFGAYVQDEWVGWSCGWFERGNTFYMANSGVLAEYRRLGIYSDLLGAVVAHATAHKARVIRSQHSVLNNPVIICKLKRGFQITGLSTSAQMGSLVELTLHLSAARAELFASRVVPLVAPP